MLLAAGAGREEDRAGGVRQSQAELQTPDAGDVDGCAAAVAHGAEESARVEVEGVHGAVAEVADQQGIVKLAEALERRPRHAPGRVELALADEPLQQVPLRVEDVDETVARPGDVVVLG